MEAEAREALTRLTAGEELRSGIEEQFARQPQTRRFAVPASEIMARIEANPPSEEERRAAAEWAEELYRSRDDDPLTDPWERYAAP